ncbi:MAG: hypothetical protein GAK28_00589 [Luteibacter sp.]|uniref:hypothetical protein n=1 Tax=Luteibacter sp. TaxID=1886636 RepID=UPI00137F2A8B|nr:hypothetical protein [Luteibacter sp.]KAF1008957.1 MAG: hypothetical protein GAK28_00589 [Luteibacter sp.]
MRNAISRSCNPLTPKERIAAFRAELHQRADFEPLVYDARMARGLAWRAELARRPIPRHRALVPVSQ